MFVSTDLLDHIACLRLGSANAKMGRVVVCGVLNRNTLAAQMYTFTNLGV
jgi:hypothetical protein